MLNAPSDARGGKKESVYQPTTGKVRAARTRELGSLCAGDTAPGHTWLLPRVSPTALRHSECWCECSSAGTPRSDIFQGRLVALQELQRVRSELSYLSTSTTVWAAHRGRPRVCGLVKRVISPRNAGLSSFSVLRDPR